MWAELCGLVESGRVEEEAIRAECQCAPSICLRSWRFPPRVKDSMVGGGQKYKTQPSLSGTRTWLLAGPGISLSMSIGVSSFEPQFPSLLCGHNTSV